MQTCIVHWDIENVRVRSGVGVSYTCNSIRTALALSNFRMVQGYAYLDSAREALTLRSELSHMGWNIVDCVCQRKPEGVDKRIIANICTSPLTYGTECVIGVISKDTDFCYSLNMLRNGGVKTILITEVDVQIPPLLTSSADIHVTVDFVPPADDPPPDSPPTHPPGPSPAAGPKPPAGGSKPSSAAQTLLWACTVTPTLDKENTWLKSSVGATFHESLRASNKKPSSSEIRSKFKEAVAELTSTKELRVDPANPHAIIVKPRRGGEGGECVKAPAGGGGGGGGVK